MIRRYVLWTSSLVILLSAACTRADVVAFPTFGVTFDAPKASEAISLTGGTELALYKFNPSSPYPGAGLRVEAMRMSGATLDEAAASMAKRVNAEISKGEFTIGGERAVKLSETFSKTSRGITFVTVHADIGYAFTGVMGPNVDITRPLQGLVDSVKFSPAESPLKHLDEPADQPFDVLGLFTVEGPRCIRTRQPSLQHLQLNIRDLTTTADGLCIDVTVYQLKNHKAFAEIQEAYSAGLQTGLKFQDPLQWHIQKDVPGLNVSLPVRCNIDVLAKIVPGIPKDSKQTALVRYCMLDLGSGQEAQLAFTIIADKDSDAKQYVDLTEHMLATIKVLPKPPTAKP